MANWLLLTPFFLYLAFGVASTWLGGWWWMAFSYGTPLIAVLVAIFRGERWPLSHPIYAIFFLFPAAMILLGGMAWPFLGLLTHRVVDWQAWIGAGFSTAATLTGILAFSFRRAWRPSGALTRAFAAAAVFGLSVLETANTELPQKELVVAQAFVKSAQTGGYRQIGPALTVEKLWPYGSDATLRVSYETYNADRDGKAICLHVYSGGLGWRWVELWPCTDTELRRLGILVGPATEKRHQGETR